MTQSVGEFSGVILKLLARDLFAVESDEGCFVLVNLVGVAVEEVEEVSSLDTRRIRFERLDDLRRHLGYLLDVRL